MKTTELLRCVEIVGGNTTCNEALLLGGLEVFLMSKPAGDGGGGDVYCIHSCGHGALAKFVLLDLAGHGREREAIGRAVHNLMHRFGDETRPARLLEILNLQYQYLSLPAPYATALSLCFEHGGGECFFANAGQPRPLHWSARTGAWSVVPPLPGSDCGLPLGVRAGACYAEERLVLDPGDTLFLSSDGITDVENGRGEFLEPDGVVRLLDRSMADVRPEKPLPMLAADFLRRVAEFQSGKGFEDDLTLLWLRRLTANISAAAGIGRRSGAADSDD